MPRKKGLSQEELAAMTPEERERLHEAEQKAMQGLSYWQTTRHQPLGMFRGCRNSVIMTLLIALIMIILSS